MPSTPLFNDGIYAEQRFFRDGQGQGGADGAEVAVELVGKPMCLKVEQGSPDPQCAGKM